jgi:hypothetical protein
LALRSGCFCTRPFVMLGTANSQLCTERVVNREIEASSQGSSMYTSVVLQMPPLGQSASVEYWREVPCPFIVPTDVVKNIILVSPLRVAPPKLPAAVENGRCGGTCCQGSNSNKIAAAVAKKSGSEKGVYRNCHGN